MLFLNEKYSTFSKSTLESITLLYKVSSIFWKYVGIIKYFLRIMSSVTVTEKIQKVEIFPTLTDIQ